MSPQIVIDDATILILGGCGGPNAVSIAVLLGRAVKSGSVLVLLAQSGRILLHHAGFE